MKPLPFFIILLVLLGLALIGTLAGVISSNQNIPCVDTSSSSSSSSSSSENNNNKLDFKTESICTSDTCTNRVCTTTGYTSQFAGSWGNVSAGQWIWFNAYVTGFIDLFDPDLRLIPVTGPVGRFSLVEQTLSLYDTGSGTVNFFINITMPDVVFEVLDSSYGNFSTVKYDPITGWYISASESCGAQFGGGIAFQANQTIYASPCGNCLKLQWCRKLITTNSSLNGNTSAATFYTSVGAYSNFTTNYSLLGVKSFWDETNAESPCGCTPFNNHTFPVGTPTNYIDYYLPQKAVYSPNNPTNPHAYTGGIFSNMPNTYCYCAGASPPTNAPTQAPPACPTSSPTESPTENPTSQPTSSPTSNPTSQPTNAPTNTPTNVPTSSPTNEPTDSPTDAPTQEPTEEPTSGPTLEPSDSPTQGPTNELISCDEKKNNLNTQIVLTVMSAFGIAAFLTLMFYLASKTQTNTINGNKKKKTFNSRPAFFK